MGRIITFSIVAILIFNGIFYFYPAEIFEAEIIEGLATYRVDISLKAYLDHSYLPEGVSVDNVVSVAPTVKGIMLLIICLLGIPIMLGYRVATKDRAPEENKNEKLEE